MYYQIGSPRRVAVISAMGAELQSLVDRQSGEEFLWQGDPTVWSGRAPILFPFVGRLKQGQYEHVGVSYEMEQHGFARKCQFDCVEATNDRLVLCLRSNAETLARYPWDFAFQVSYFWHEDKLVAAYEISNLDAREMLFNIGSHPAFRLPLANAKIEDYRIAFSHSETLDTWSIVDGLLDPTPTRFLTQQQQFGLTSTLFDNDALVFMNVQSNVVSLSHVETGTRVSVETDGAPHLGIWAKPAAPYVCIEPWWGYADLASADGVLENKAAVQRLAAGGVFKTHIAIDTFTPPVL